MTDLDEWQKQIIRMSAAMVEEVQPELITIAEDAVRGHGPLPADNPATVMQLAHVLSQVQDESFLLGMKLGMKMVLDVLKQQKSEESEASKL